MSTLNTSAPAAAAGLVVRPGDSRWDVARRAFNLLVDQRPAEIAFPTNEREVAAIVGRARQRGLRASAQATGHNAAPLGPLDGTLLVNTSQLTGISIDAGERRVRVGAGVKWQDVIPKLSELELAALHGSSPDVGVVGYSLGGGMGWLARRHGLQANAVTAFEIVTADGDLVRVDAGNEPDLFWALRGGGGSFGVVTAVEFVVQPVDRIYVGALFFPADKAADVLHTWHDELPSYPDELMTWTALMQFPPLPFVPDHLQGRAFAVVLGAFLGAEDDGRDLLRSIRGLGADVDTFATVPPVSLAELAMDPPDPLPYRSAHAITAPLPASAIEELVQAADMRPGAPLAMVQLRHLGGALARHEVTAGARATIPGHVALFSVGSVTDGPSATAVADGLGAVVEAVAPHRVGHTPNFVEEPTDASRFFDRATWTRLREVKRRYDPADLFRGNHHVPPSAD
jgi:FAD/FMN-containing dehydrogenase